MFSFVFLDSFDKCALQLEKCWIRSPPELFFFDELKRWLEQPLGVASSMLERNHPLDVVAASHHKLVHKFAPREPHMAILDFRLNSLNLLHIRNVFTIESGSELLTLLLADKTSVPD